MFVLYITNTILQILEAMKRKNLPASALFLILALSMGAFLYVNADAYHNGRPSETPTALQESSLPEDECTDAESRKVPVPAIGVLTKIAEIVQKFGSVSPR